MKLRLIATATFGLEAVVSRELKALGYESHGTRPGWLAFEGDEGAIARANLWLRSSDRVLVEVGAFRAEDFGELFDRTLDLPWEALVPKDAHLPVRGRSVKSKLSSVPACQRIVKKAVVERLKKAHGVQTLPETGPSYAVEIALLRDEVTLLLDTSGAGLHKRGYRPRVGAAPLKETLAAGLVLLSFWNRERPFLDPFCGTGTIAIEAALIGRNRAPGLGRSFASESWTTLSPDIWRDAREEAAARVSKAPLATMIASDIDPEALAMARQHARKAGVARDLRFEQKPFADIRCDETFGCLITNPPYGDRLGDASEVRALYRSMPEVLRRFETWSHYVLTAVKDFEKIIGQEADRRRKLYNGRIECTYYQFHGPTPGQEVARPAFGGLDEKAARQADLFAKRLKKRAHHFRKWPTKRHIEAYRVYDRDIKEVPLTVDRYGDTILLSPTGHALTSRTRAEHEDWLDRMAAVAADVLGVSPENVAVAGRAFAARRLTVREGDLLYEVAIAPDGETGLAPAHRRLRQRARELAPGRRFLDLNTVSGAFSVAAAAGGAVKVTSVGPSASLGPWAERNLALNQLDTRRKTIRSEVGKFLESEPNSYDLVIWKPDSDGDRELQVLSPRLADGGIVFVVGVPRLKVEDRSWTVRDVSERMLSEDFRSSKRHRCWELSKRPSR